MSEPVKIPIKKKKTKTITVEEFKKKLEEGKAELTKVHTELKAEVAILPANFPRLKEIADDTIEELEEDLADVETKLEELQI